MPDFKWERVYRRRPNFKSDTFRLLPTFEQALIDEHDDGRRED